MPKIILASASPRRAEMLRKLGLDFEVAPVEIDESLHPGERPTEYALRLAREKAEASRAIHPDALVIGADTVVAVHRASLGKPSNREEAREMLQLLSGGQHRVITAVAVAGEEVFAGSCETDVNFKELTSAEVEWYLDSDEPYDKAGAYGIQGLASLFIDRIEGSHANVVGLPVHLLPGLFAEHGIDLLALVGSKISQV